MTKGRSFMSDNIISNIIDNILGDEPKSVFIFAGAGSGKTYTLVQILKAIKTNLSKTFVKQGRKVGVITYTNAAVDEIKSRIEFDQLFNVSTIHSFIWENIKTFQIDIKNCYLSLLNEKRQELESELQGGKRAAPKKQKKLDDLCSLISNVEQIDLFKYSPEGLNTDIQSLSHDIVLKIGADLIIRYPRLQAIIVNKYPYLFIDESQDTNKGIVRALLALERNCQGRVTLVIVGDSKQRIYTDGEVDLSKLIPEDWIKYKLGINYRSSNRIVELGNHIATTLEDNAEQEPYNKELSGVVRLFLTNVETDIQKQNGLELEVRARMSEITDDDQWKSGDVKILVLEHLMAARRLGFEKLYKELNSVNAYKNSLMRGELSVMSVFKSFILPLWECIKQGDEYGIIYLVRKNTDYFKPDNKTKDIRENRKKAILQLRDTLKTAQSCGEIASIREILTIIKSGGLMPLHKTLSDTLNPELDLSNCPDEVRAWHRIIDEPISAILNFLQYITDNTEYATHQGVKGLQFDRVLGIIDDANANGFLFKYDKLFGVAELSKTDLKNIEENAESVLDRTGRLLYVICTRAKKSLALLVFTENPDKAKDGLLEKGWFSEDEIQILG